MLTIPDEVVKAEVIGAIYDLGYVRIDRKDLPVNNYAILRAEEDRGLTALARHKGGGLFVLLNRSTNKKSTISPRDSKQAAFVDALNTKEILLSTAIGTAGTGKTTLAISYAVDQYMKNRKPIFLSKPTYLVGNNKAFGAVPGDVKEKYSPYLTSYKIVLKKILGDSADQYINQMEKKQDLQYIPIELARGCTFENCTFILDEAQNLRWHELNTIISRMGEDTKMIILGDPRQIDIKMNEDQTGLHKLITSHAYLESSISSAVELTTQYRSPITQLIADIDEELRGTGGEAR